MTVVTLNGKSVETKDSNGAREFLAEFRKASKAGAVSTDLLAGATVLYGNPVDETKAVTDGTAQIAEGRALILAGEAQVAEHKDNAAKWLTLAVLAKDGGVSARAFGEAVGCNPNTLGRLVRASEVLEASRANKTPMTLAEAITYANQHNASETTALIVAYNEAEEGTDPTKDVAGTIAPEPKPVTLAQAMRALDKAAEMIAEVAAGTVTLDKAETLEVLRKQTESITRLAKQHATIVAKAERTMRTPARKSA